MERSPCVPTGCPHNELKSEFQGELDLTFGNGCANQQACCVASAARSATSQRRAVCRKDICITISRLGWRKVWMVDDVEHLHAELDIEDLRDLLHRNILEDREIEAGDPRSNDTISPGVTPQVETHERRQGRTRSGHRWIHRIRDRSAKIGRIRSAVRLPEGQIGCGGELEALGTKVVCRITGIHGRSASRASQPIRIRIVIATVRIGGIATGSIRGSKRNTVTSRKDKTQLPSTGKPVSYASPGLGEGKVPSTVHNQRSANVEIRKASGQFHVEPIEARDGIPKGIACDGR